MRRILEFFSDGNYFFLLLMSLMEVPSREVLALGCSTPLEPSAGRRHFLLRGTDFAESSPQRKDRCMNRKAKLHFCRPLTMQCTDFFRCGCNGALDFATRQVVVPLLAPMMPLCYRYFCENRPDASPGAQRVASLSRLVTRARDPARVFIK